MNKLEKFLEKFNENLPEDYSDYLLINYICNIGVIIFMSIVCFVGFIMLVLLLPIYTILCIINMIIKYDYEIKSKNILKNVLPNWAIELHKNHPYYKLDIGNRVISTKSLDTFILDFMIDYNNRFDTFTHHGFIVCYTGKRRSLGDIYLICKGYYPDCTIEDVFKILIRMLDDGTINGSYCNTINKFVFYNSSSHNNFDVKVEYKEGIKFKQLLELYKNK